MTFARRSGFRGHARCVAAMLALAWAAPAVHAQSQSQAQVSLASAVDLAFRNDPKILAARTDIVRTRAVLSQAKDAFVPVVNAEGGVGRSTGVPLGLPTIFTINAQSLAFNWSQRDYIRSARSGWDAAKYSLQEAEDDAAEDVAKTYLALDNAQQRKVAAEDALNHAQQLLRIVNDRVTAGEDPHIEIPQTDLTVIDMQEQLVSINNDIATLSDHLDHLTGLRDAQLGALHTSIPPLPSATEIDGSGAPAPMSNPGIEAAFASAAAKRETAAGDKRYLYRPRMEFEAEYSRITTAFSNYETYYPAFNPANNPNISYNALSVGVSVQVPLFDQGHRAQAAQSAAEARRAELDALDQQNQFLEGNLKLRLSTTNLDFAARRAQDNAEIAQDQLEAVLTQLKPGAVTPSGQPLTPKDEQNARLAVAERRLDLLNAELQLDQAKITLMRQNNELAGWLHAAFVPSTAPVSQP